MYLSLTSVSFKAHPISQSPDWIEFCGVRVNLAHYAAVRLHCPNTLGGKHRSTARHEGGLIFRVLRRRTRREHDEDPLSQ